MEVDPAKGHQHRVCYLHTTSSAAGSAQALTKPGSFPVLGPNPSDSDLGGNESNKS